MKLAKALFAVALAATMTGCAAEPAVQEETKPEPNQVESSLYEMNAHVTLTEYIENGTTVLCEDADGLKYAFRGEGFEVGDDIVLVLDNKGTPEYTDDSIEDVLV